MSKRSFLQEWIYPEETARADFKKALDSSEDLRDGLDFGLVYEGALRKRKRIPDLTREEFLDFQKMQECLAELAVVDFEEVTLDKLEKSVEEAEKEQRRPRIPGTPRPEPYRSLQEEIRRLKRDCRVS